MLPACHVWLPGDLLSWPCPSKISCHCKYICMHTHTYRPYTVSDVEAVDISFYNSLKYVQENDPAPLDLTFSVLEESFGQVGINHVVVAS